MTLRDLVHSELPLNRKERFFTGTVFPMVVCRDNFRHFHLFASLIDGCPDPSASVKSTNIQFFTEYSLAESIVTTADRERFRSPPRTKNTPDIIVLLAEPPKTLLSVEAKMYDAPDANALKTQLDNQRKHVDYLKAKLNIPLVRQCALLPEKLAEQVGYQSNGKRYVSDSAYQIMTWEEIHQLYQRVYKGDYFLDLLRLALDSYPELVSKSWTLPDSVLKLQGLDIYQRYRSGELNVKIMGRDQGLEGERLRRDIESGRWKRQQYETSTKESLPSLNWFPIEEFVKRVDSIERTR